MSKISKLFRVSLLPVMTLAIMVIALLSQPLPLAAAPSPDFDGNGVVDVSDFLLFVNVFGSQRGQEKYEAKYDLDGDGVIAVSDFLIFIESFGMTVISGGDEEKMGAIYWTDEETEKIQRSNLDGTDVEDIIISGLKDPVSIALDESAGKMYWVDRNTDKIYRASLDGTKVKELVNTRGLSEPPSSSYKSAAPYGIALDVAGSKMYWTDQVQEKIWRANLDGSNVEALVNTTDLASDGTNPSSIALDVAGGKMYWTDWDTNKIHRADLNGSNVEEVITSGVTFSRGITLDLINRKIYYTDTSTDKIRRANLDGTNVEELVDTRRIVDPPLDSGGTSPLDITLDVDGGKMYWADEKTAKIYRANLDGTQVEILPISGLQRPVGIAVISSNSAPVTRGIISTKTLSVGTDEIIDMSDYFSDPDNDVLTYIASSSNESIATVVVMGSQVTVSPVISGQATITVTVTDAGGLMVSQTVEVVVIQTVIPEQKLYWTDEETEKIQRSNLDGTDVEDIIISGLKDPVSIALDESAGKMYWVDRNTDKIYRASLDGTKVKELVNTRGLSEPPSSSYKSAAPYGIALDVAGSKMYWTDQVQEKIWRANLDGSNVEALVNTTDLASDGTNPSSIALDVAGGKMYWTDWDTNKIHRADLNGSNVEEVITSGVTFSRGITLDLINRKIYYTDTSTDKIRRANLDGTNVEELVDTRRIVDPPLDSGGTSPLDITLDVDGGKMYWADEKTAKIYRANLDGTQVEILPISGLQRPVGIAVISSNSAPVTRGIISTKTLSVGTDEIIDMSDYFSDPDNDVLTYIASSSNESIATVVVMGSQVTVSPVISGQATITVTVTDAGGLMVSQTVEVVVIQTVIPEQKLYWTDEETEKIQRSNLDGTDVEDIIISGLKDPVSIALDESAGKMYWVDRNTDKIYRASLDGTKVKELVNTRGLSEPPSSSYKSAAPYGIALDVAGSKMYWTDQVQEKIWRANLDGSNVEALVNTTDLASDGTNPSSIALDVAGGKMYWTDWDTNKIHRADLNGSNVEEVITSGVTFSRGITLDLINRKIYYTDTSTDKIRRANLDGTNVEELVDTRRIVDPPLDNGGTSPLDITLDVDGGKMYWADEKTAKIYRANLDGTQVEILPISGLQTPVGIAVISSK